VQEGAVEKLARFGLVAQGVSFVLVAVLAIKLALGEGGTATDRQGALRTIAQGGIGRLLVIALALGFACYALWRLFEAVFGSKLESNEDESAWKRIGALGKAAIYGALCAAAVSILTGEGGGSGDEEKKATAGILGWPGGKWIVMAIAAGIAIAALWNLYRGISGRFLDQLKTGEMSSRARSWTTRIGVVGLLARAVVFGLISWFFFDAAANYNANKAEGLDGALRKLAAEDYGTWLLGIVAAGLFAYGLFCVIQARYREV
jgi:formate hydrogenlyase subunit 3/multisubunit Na+/H+ antiporter MnhD subunit